MSIRRALAGIAAVFMLVVSGGAVVANRTAVDPPVDAVTIAGIDAHDGMIYYAAGAYHLVGTQYDCGFHWGHAPSTPWCGFAVYTAPALAGPWTFVRELFDPAGTSPFHSRPWQTVCGNQGRGCFNPRMAQRPDGVWILYWNAPDDLATYNANGYYAAGCNGPDGPCGAPAGPPYGSTTKPAMYLCNGAEDFSIVDALDGSAYILCVDRDRRFRVEKLDAWWVNGTNVGATALGGLQFVEGQDMVRLADGTWLLIFGDNCPFCPGTDASYATAPAITGPWTVPPWGRRVISQACGGQTRTIAELPEGLFVLIDTWDGSNDNEEIAQLQLERLAPTGAPLQSAPTGAPHVPPFRQFTCV